MGNRQNVWIEKKMRKLRRTFGCGRCGTHILIEFAHLTETKVNGKGRGRKERFYDILKHPEAYAPLCHEHHEMFDAKLFGDWKPYSLAELRDMGGRGRNNII